MISPSYLLLLLNILQLQRPGCSGISTSLTAACAVQKCWRGNYLASLLEFLKLARCIGFANDVLRLLHIMFVSVLETDLSFMMRCVGFIVRCLVILVLFFILLLHRVILIVWHWSLNDLKCLDSLLLRGIWCTRVSRRSIFWQIACWCLRAARMVRWRDHWRRNTALFGPLDHLFSSLCFERSFAALRHMIFWRWQISLNCQGSWMR